MGRKSSTQTEIQPSAQLSAPVWKLKPVQDHARGSIRSSPLLAIQSFETIAEDKILIL
jgi:hypothetical protein